MTEKKCKRCDETKSLDDFYKHKAMGDGYLSFCKRCTTMRIRDHRVQNLENTKIIEKNAYENNKEKKLKRSKAYGKTPRGKLATRRGNRNYREKYPDKHKAKNILSNAVRDGKLKKEPCMICGTNENIHAHHMDYSKPLDVAWLCIDHHVKLHNIIRQHFTG